MNKEKYYKNFKYNFAENTDYDTDEEFYSQKYENREGRFVDALYTPTISELDKGNIFIEALPRMRSEERLLLDAHVVIPNFNHDILIRRSLSEQIALLNDLYSIRLVLPIQKILDGLFYNLLVKVYRSREYDITEEPFSGDYSSKGEDTTWTESFAYGKIGEAPPAGFSLLGYAGCGKTSMLQTMFNHYPQVIRHKSGNYNFPQILYLLCNSNSSSQNDFASVLNDIARQVDLALGLNDGSYYNQIVKMTNYDKKIGFIKILINKFNIGVIAIDEIQSLDFSKNHKETYSKLLQITNDTKVSFILCGTEDAYKRMFDSLHMTRRFSPISASSYTGNLAFVEMFTRELLKYQWFEEKDVIDIPPLGEKNEEFSEFVGKFYECTNGIAAIMVNLYEKMSFEYLIRKRKPKVDGEYIEKVFQKYFSGMDKIIQNLDREFSYSETKKSLTYSNKRRDEILAELEIKETLDKVVSYESQKDKESMAALLSNMTRSLEMSFGDNYSNAEIQNVCKNILSRKESIGKTEHALTIEARDKLFSKTKTKTKNTKNKANNLPIQKGFSSFSEI